MKKVIILSVLIFTTSCQLMLRGTSERISLSSNPSDATVIIDGVEVGKTPLHLTLSRCSDRNIIFEKSGYREKYYLLERSWDGFLSAALTGPLSLVDESTCASFEYRNQNISINMNKALVSSEP